MNGEFRVVCQCHSCTHNNPFGQIVGKVQNPLVGEIIKIGAVWVEINRIEGESAIVDMTASCQSREEAQRWARV